jgi:hypothetical protein
MSLHSGTRFYVTGPDFRLNIYADQIETPDRLQRIFLLTAVYNGSSNPPRPKFTVNPVFLQQFADLIQTIYEFKGEWPKEPVHFTTYVLTSPDLIQE